MQDDEKAAIRSMLREEIGAALSERSRIDVDEHNMHHLWVASEIDRRRKREERVENLRRHVLGWGFVIAIAGAGRLIYDGILKHLIGALNK